jgi:hypothetical protein
LDSKIFKKITMKNNIIIRTFLALFVLVAANICKKQLEIEPRQSEPAQLKQTARVAFVPQTSGSWI